MTTPGFGNSNVGITFAPGTWNPHDPLTKVRTSMTQVAKAEHATAVDIEPVHLDGTTAYRYRVTEPVALADGTTTLERVGQLWLISGKNQTIVSVGAANDAAGRALVNTNLASVRRT